MHKKYIQIRKVYLRVEFKREKYILQYKVGTKQNKNSILKMALLTSGKNRNVKCESLI